MVTIYMPLPDEGTSVWRPVEARHISGDLYEVHGPVPEEEQWAFAPGDVVLCAQRTFTDGERHLTAYAGISGPRRAAT